MSIPVTSRLDESVVQAMDNAVEAGLAPNRSAVIAAALREWLHSRSEAEIEASYRRRYNSTDAGHDELVANLARFSVAACLAEHEA